MNGSFNQWSSNRNYKPNDWSNTAPIYWDQPFESQFQTVNQINAQSHPFSHQRPNPNSFLGQTYPVIVRQY
jgi:hypothetical protein